MKATAPTINQNLLGCSYDRSLVIHSHQKVTPTAPHQQHQTTNLATRHAHFFSSLLHLNLQIPHPPTPQHPFIDWKTFLYQNQTAPFSPKEDISSKWREIHGSSDWDNLLNPLHPWLRREIIKYGEFAQATYDAFDFDSFSEYCGSCRYNRHNLFPNLGLGKNGYMVSKYIYAMSHIDVPRWLERSHHLMDTWSKDSNWMGYVANSDDEESIRIGRRDIVVAWRGTVAPSEWFEDLQGKLEHLGDGDVKVEHGFLDIYTSKSESTRYNKSSASDQVMNEITRLVNFYRARGEEVSLTITGHSLGGALSLLNAYEAAKAIPDLPVNVISFGAPRVGNNAFKEKLCEMGVKTLRLVVKQDLVPKMPGIIFNEGLHMFDEMISRASEWHYTHVGTELKLDVHTSPYLKKGFNLPGFHSLETYLHLVDGFRSTTSTFRVDARRELALLNKANGMLVDELRIPENWYQLANKGLVQNSNGRWAIPKRDSEDIPSPPLENHHLTRLLLICILIMKGLNS
ncbi:phospholipase A1-Igamma1, chloroplastic-like [Telopea speciosissima]|uniref:phospholipase A1-Igamma1, chloroplastic-like n=1 Tax=Telopea speciosissima TaxID=54955 RepID=UPI001CC77B1A|nr:phospholipase A1-Igamma1, chloroplastic-like [Telopea speciosissima]